MTTKQYKIVNGISFDEQTNERVVNALVYAYTTGKRVRLWYGDIKTGKAWNEEHDVKGNISRSAGSVRIPLLINNSRSLGGGGVLDNCIVRIDIIESHQTIYKHEKFHTDDYTVKPIQNKELLEKGYNYSVGEGIANFKSEDKAKRYAAFMIGNRYTK